MPNQALEPTPNSFRSCVASAIGRGSPRAFRRGERVQHKKSVMPPDMACLSTIDLTPQRGEAGRRIPVSTPADTDLLDAVHRIAPVIQQHADAAERAGRLAPATVAAMRDARLFRMFTP